MAKAASLYRMVTAQHICPFGLKAKDLLQRHGYDIDDHRLTSRQQTEQFKQYYQVDTTPQIYIDDQRIGGYEALRQYFGMASAKPQGTSYTPVIVVFLVAALLALAIQPALAGSLTGWLMNFVAFAMVLLAVQKLRDLYSFSNQFITYDLLAMRYVRYAYIYPFAEALAGVGMLAGIVPVVVAAVALFIGLVGALSVIKAVYIDKRELKCACVGGDSNVPLGLVSLAENLLMLGAGSWMLLHAI